MATGTEASPSSILQARSWTAFCQIDSTHTWDVIYSLEALYNLGPVVQSQRWHSGFSKKTEVLHHSALAAPYTTPHITVNGHRHAVADKFVYLGSTVSLFHHWWLKSLPSTDWETRSGSVNSCHAKQRNASDSWSLKVLDNEVLQHAEMHEAHTRHPHVLPAPLDWPCVWHGWYPPPKGTSLLRTDPRQALYRTPKATFQRYSEGLSLK